ncbi:MAG: hypothetical protein Q8K78_18350 [Planctomycetaceae bacterium]|nr:hypothetical protein [Planctomycetaceae bacterium]
MSERYWYQDGGTVFGIVLVTAFIGFLGYSFRQKAQEEARPYVIPDVAANINQPLFGSPSLVVTVWHTHTGVLRNGRLTVSTSGELVETRSGLHSQSHSFEVWEPNRDRAVTLTFPLKHFDATREIPISFTLIGQGIKPFTYSDAWLGNTWKSNKKASP